MKTEMNLIVSKKTRKNVKYYCCGCKGIFAFKYFKVIKVLYGAKKNEDCNGVRFFCDNCVIEALDELSDNADITNPVN